MYCQLRQKNLNFAAVFPNKVERVSTARETEGVVV